MMGSGEYTELTVVDSDNSWSSSLDVAYCSKRPRAHRLERRILKKSVRRAWTVLIFLDFKLSPCPVCNMFSFG